MLLAQDVLRSGLNPDQDTTVYTWVDRMPVFAGCNPDEEQADVCSARELTLFLYKNLRYPGEALQTRQGGKTMLKVLIGKRGEIRSARVEVSSGVPALDREAIRLAESMPSWSPGRMGDRPVLVEIGIPVVFAPEMFARD